MNPLSLRRISVAAGVTCALLLPIAAVHADESPSAAPSAAPIAAESQAFTVGITDDVDSMNPFTGIVSTAYEMYQLMYPTLTENSADDFSPGPGLAESWEESADKKTWTYKIRPGLTWSDGAPLTARDAAYSFNRVMNGDYEQTNYISYVANITKAEATDDTTLVLTVDKPSPIMENLAVYILPEHIWKDIDGKEVRSFENEPTEGQPIVGAGPYVLIDREKGQFIRFKANPDYYGGPPAVDELTFRVYKNGDAVAQALRKGEIDFADELQANVFDAIKDEPGVTAVNAAYYGFNEIGMNVGAALADGTPIGDGNPALKDKKVRQAINHAIDRQTLVDKVAVYGTPGSTIIPPLYDALHLQPTTLFDYDPVKAGQLLDEAGYPVGADGKRVGPDGKPLTLRLLGRQESQTSQQTVQFVEGWLEEIGITVDTTIVTEDTLIELNGEGRFDLFEWGWVVEPDPDYQLSTFTCAQRSSKEDGQSTPGCRTRTSATRSTTTCTPSRPWRPTRPSALRSSRRCSRSSTTRRPTPITYYYDLLQAYRSDRFTNFVQQPKDSGPLLFQFGTWSYESITPAGAAQQARLPPFSGTGMNPALLAGLGALVAAAIAAVVLVVRRRSSDEDTE